MKIFLVNFQHRGERYVLELPAHDADDAQARLKSLVYGRVMGQLAHKLPAAFKPFVGVTCLLRNLLSR